MKSLKVLIFFILLVSGVILNTGNVYSGGGSTVCGDTNSWTCDPSTYSCSPVTGECTISCSCSDGSGGTCAAGSYKCNRDEVCCPYDPGEEAPKPPPECPWQPVNCPTGTVVDLNQPIGDPFVAKISYCPPPGTAQRVTGCARLITAPDECEIKCQWSEKKQTEVCRKDCYPGESWCVSNYIQNYRCVSLAPPHASTITYTLLNPTSSTNCSASTGYMGKEANNVIRIYAEVPTTSQSNALGEIRVWLGSTPPATDSFSATITQNLARNDQIGFAVKKTGSSWLDIYAPTKYNTSNVAGTNIQAWAKIGTVGSGLRGEIKGPNNLKLAGISNVSVTTVGTNTRVTFDLTPYHASSGLTSYEEIRSGMYNLRATPKYVTASSYVTSWPVTNNAVIIDLVDPVNNSISVATVDATRIDVAWAYSDALTGIKRVVGDASITGASNPSVIDDTTSGVLGYTFGSGSTNLDGTHLWTTTSAGRTDRIDLKNNKRGTITFSTIAFDNACNRGLAQNSSYTMAIPWIASKGGPVFGGSGIDLDLPTLTGTDGFTAEPYWGSPFSFAKNRADYTSELSSATSASISSLLYPDAVGTHKSQNHFDQNNKQGYWYDRLLLGNSKQVLESPTSFNTVVYTGNATFANRSTAISNNGVSCSATRTCVVKVAGNLTLSNGFVCDTRTTFFVAGSTTVNPEINAPSMDDGCIIVSKGNITVGAGTYKSGSSTHPLYDIIQAFLVSDGQINIVETDTAQTVKDGLLVHGSMIAFGSTTPSINIERGFSNAHNSLYPVFVIHYDPRYLSMAKQVFGGDDDGYRREVGFKPL